ncbi:hypothetical protein Dfer_2236 [Dyadobacter fermentans DSM 18053]|uniref:Uncharacterized protein n=2 Tax=Dyadobacter fermentans TaxID=94254 RepID=C6VYV3_DYAFD|nr:hypothetical protein Dfer_2236 [Dyadobacter fermentans DSM 18053]
MENVGCLFSLNLNKMDIRETLSMNENFLKILTGCKERNAKAEMIIDQNGLERAEGLIREIYPQSDEPYLELEDGTVIVLKTLVAVNGVFLPSYSEC